MSDFEIVEYDHSYAAALADMWNKSGDSWGGYNIEFTAESIVQEEEGSTCVNRYMAVVGDEVVGYIKLSQWTQDEGALYVDVLNVRPDFHGKKIGKALLLRTIDRTTELGWPRLDLHTWGGNTKAVPLYKKSGFFWEERDREVYCVNFIPGVLHNELAADFFERADWYLDSTRPIEVKPDGRKENEFTYFTYSWKKDGRFLRMEYARKGRGLCAVDRNEYRVSARVEALNLVFGRSYAVRYEFENRGPSPLEIEIEGKNDKNIRFDFSHTARVTQTYSAEAEFFVGPIEQVQSDWKTHPRVSADISINGKTASFDVGIAPRFPADIKLVGDGGLAGIGRPSRAYLDVESNLTAGATFVFRMPHSECCEISEDRLEKRLGPKERTSIAIPFLPRRSGVYSGRVEAQVVPDPGTTRGGTTEHRETGHVSAAHERAGQKGTGHESPDHERAAGEARIEFQKEVGLRVPMLSGAYHGEMPTGSRERVYTIGNGPYSLSLFIERDSHLNLSYLSNDRVGRGGVLFFPPKLGRPYSEEFIRKRPESIDVEESFGAVDMRARYRSDDFPGVHLTMCFRLHPCGVVDRWFVVENGAGGSNDRELSLLDEFRLEIDRLVLPYRGRIVKTRSETDAAIYCWDSERISGNWMFTRSGDGTRGFFWSEGVRPRSQEWLMSFEHAIGALDGGGRYVSPTTSAFIDTFATWQELREYATGCREKAPSTVSAIALRVNDGNPFPAGPFTAEVVEHRQSNLDGTVELISEAAAAKALESGRRSMPVSQSFEKDHRAKRAAFELPPPSTAVEVVAASLDLDVVRSRRSAAVFSQGEGSLSTSREEREGYEVLTATNGVLSIALAADFSPCLLSCRHDGLEWLDGSFPELGPRDWWNPWLGGMCFKPARLGEQPLLKEMRSAEFVEKTDNYGNRWSGIATAVTLTEHETYRGLQYVQYFMMLPGVPVLFQQVEVRQNTGTHFARNGSTISLFVGGEPTTDTVFSFVNESGSRVEVGSGREETWHSPRGPITVRLADSTSRMIVYFDGHRCSRTAVTNKRTSQIVLREEITCPDGRIVWTAPAFLVFAGNDLDSESLRALQDVTLG